MLNKKIKCTGIQYRQEFIDIQTNIHDGFINIETWMVSPSVNLEKSHDIADANIKDTDIIGNTELEISISQARQLINLLQQAVDKSQENI